MSDVLQPLFGVSNASWCLTAVVFLVRLNEVARSGGDKHVQATAAQQLVEVTPSAEVLVSVGPACAKPRRCSIITPCSTNYCSFSLHLSFAIVAF